MKSKYIHLLYLHCVAIPAAHVISTKRLAGTQLDIPLSCNQVYLQLPKANSCICL